MISQSTLNIPSPGGSILHGDIQRESPRPTGSGDDAALAESSRARRAGSLCGRTVAAGCEVVQGTYYNQMIVAIKSSYSVLNTWCITHTDTQKDNETGCLWVFTPGLLSYHFYFSLCKNVFTQRGGTNVSIANDSCLCIGIPKVKQTFNLSKPQLLN